MLQVLEGMEVVRLASKVPTDQNDKATVAVVISDAYVYDVQPFAVPLQGADGGDGFPPKMSVLSLPDPSHDVSPLTP